MSKKLLTLREAAELANCHPETIRRAISRGELKAFRQLGRKGYRVYEEDVMGASLQEVTQGKVVK